MFRTPSFYLGIVAIILLSLAYFSVQRLPKSIVTGAAILISNPENLSNSEEGILFFNQNKVPFLESPELKIMQENSLAAFYPPRVLSTKVLGALFGQGPQIRKEIIEYAVQSNDTLQSIATSFDISLDTLLWANDLRKSSKIKIGQKLIILPVSGVVHFVKSGDTLSEIAEIYKSSIDEIVELNEIANESDIYIGDILIVPNGVMPKRAPTFPETYLADNYFIFPVEGKITQGLHWYNGVDVANKCGTPIFSAAPGTVLRARYGWNSGGGNIVTILHKDGVVTYYGHLGSISVNPGDIVDVGQKIGLMGGQPGTSGAGISTGCHLHFTVIGAKNPLRTLPLGYEIKYVQ